MAKLKKHGDYVKLKLKQEKALRIRREVLKNDIITFLVEYHKSINDNPVETWIRILREGCKGYDKMRDKELIRHFEEVQLTLNNGAGMQFVEYKYSWSHNIKNIEHVRKPEEVREELLSQANVLSTRLMEVIFKFNEED